MASALDQGAVPLCIRRIENLVPVEVCTAVVPPHGPSLSERYLGRLNACPCRRQQPIIARRLVTPTGSLFVKFIITPSIGCFTNLI